MHIIFDFETITPEELLKVKDTFSTYWERSIKTGVVSNPDTDTIFSNIITGADNITIYKENSILEVNCKIAELAAEVINSTVLLVTRNEETIFNAYSITDNSVKITCFLIKDNMLTDMAEYNPEEGIYL